MPFSSKRKCTPPPRTSLMHSSPFTKYPASPLPSMYIFQQLFNSAWSGGSAISEHIVSLCTLEACLAGMKFMVNTRLPASVLLNSLPKTLEWNMFTSSIINTIENSKLTFNTVETRITSEEARLNPSGSSDSALKVSNKSSTCPPNSAACVGQRS
ncbi:hypothetical protein PAXRUDRAFT_16480 [Paxillus rubicundulus Ve08.2h10]|uniref:Uncharacterized protein n=1 Tax=Paxillus rubicundulus Ve08.2h10 TaxID=930991 RepID=A0A0D0CUT1_9AGAM|nr:hypothetical protein PAXRUDRAFT_19471 [Paxillus rubicundulus Ve08.2h10]KIK79151.1 hypothetical protein PAXRUDRAFT_16480 [Paxillus rubicundulus Ve08.2h10]